MIQKLRWKFVLINMLLVTVIVGAMCVLMVVATRDNLRQKSIALLYRAASEESSVVWPREHRGGPRQEDGVNLPYFTVAVGIDGTTVLLENQFGAVEDTQQLMAIVRSCMSQEADSGVLSGYSLRYLRQDSLLGWRIVFADISQEEMTVRSLCRHLVAIGMGTLTVFFFISLALARWATRPVEESWKRERQFVSDASHELKTPLTVILSNVDLLQSREAFSGGAEGRWLDNIKASSGQMAQLVEELLTLARSDNLGEKNIIRERVDFSELTEDEGLMFEPVLFEAGKELVSDIEEGISVMGDPSKLRQLLEILLDNARKYAAPSSVVTLSLKSEGSKRVRLGVTTAGEPLTPEQRERIFERFYRADEARTSEGFGLGLSIADTIAREHDGRIWAESDPDKGNTFFVSLPK